MNDRPLHIAYIVDSFPALSETFILDQIASIVARGHAVTIFSHHRPSAGVPVHPDVGKQHLMECVRYFNIPEGILARVFSGLLVGVSGLIHNPAVVLGSLNPRWFGRNALNLRMLYWTVPFLDEHFDVIHAHYGTNGAIASNIRQLGIPGKLVCQFHGYDIRLGQVDGGKRYAGLIKNCDRLLAISEYSRVALLKFGADPRKIILHPNGIDSVRFFTERSRRSQLPDTVRILSVARLVHEKGIEYGIRAIRALVDRDPSQKIEYRIVGDGPLRGELESLAAELGIVDQVKFLGPLDRREVISELQCAHIFMLPSLAENLPSALLEAHAAGLPVVAADVGAIAQVVEDGASGYLVHPGDPAMLAARLADLLDAPNRWYAMGEWGRDHVIAQYELAHITDRLEKLYSDLASRS